MYGLTDEEVHKYAECSDINTPGMIRVSFGIYNTEEEVEQLAMAVKNIRKEMGLS
jgi:selenocysteine lyase/cysteine desulfurase